MQGLDCTSIKIAGGLQLAAKLQEAAAICMYIARGLLVLATPCNAPFTYLLQFFSIAARFWFCKSITVFVIRVTWQVPLVEQELLTFPEPLSSLPGFSGVHVAQSLVFLVFCRSLFALFPLFILSIALSVLLRFTASNNPLGILHCNKVHGSLEQEDNVMSP